jgi:hypothetical protein
MNVDQPAFLVTQPSGVRSGVDPVVRAEDSASFYDYFSASAHTGFERVGESRIYLYEDSDNRRLSLVISQGTDDDLGMIQPAGIVNMDITGLPAGFSIDLSDDNPGEFFASGPTSASGRWQFQQNTDGGIIGGLPFPGAWTVTVTASFEEGITSWVWIRGDGTRIPLSLTDPVTIQASGR